MCLFPINAEPQEFGRPKFDKEGSLKLPCGKCFECISKRAMDWSLRARHEISCHDENCFLTLTYDDENLPSFLIVKKEFQNFMKRLRKQLKVKLRYMVSHEYGGKTGRPHHHAIIFGYNPCSQKYLMEAPSGEPLFTSTEIEKLWPFGFHSIGTANEKTAYYIASYSLKSSKHNITNPNTGEIITVTDSMDASKRPAIGAEYFHKNKQQLIDSDTFLPRYYQKLLERDYPNLLEQYEEKQAHNMSKIQQRGDHQKLAKYVTTLQQKNQSISTYRQTPESIDSDTRYKNHLKDNRDNYVAKNKGKYYEHA